MRGRAAPFKPPIRTWCGGTRPEPRQGNTPAPLWSLPDGQRLFRYFRACPLDQAAGQRGRAGTLAALAASRGMSLSELIRASLGGLRLRTRREAPPVAPELLRELARIGNNLNQLARAANRHEPVTATALLSRLIEIDRDLGALRAAHTRADPPERG